MKTLKKILIWLLAIIVVLIVIGFLLPSKYKVERSTTIHARSSVIYDLTSHFEKWDLWTPWTSAIDSTAKFETVGPDATVGTKRSWDGKILKNGEMLITKMVPNELFAYDLSFEHGKYQSKGYVGIVDNKDSCKVSWVDEGDLGSNPFNRYFGLFMGKMMGPDFEKGLAKLRQVAEERNGWPRIEEVKIPAQAVITITDSGGPNDYGKIMGKAYGELYSVLKKNKLTQTGNNFSICLKWDSVTKFSVLKIGIPVDNRIPNSGRVVFEKIPTMNGVMAYYYGPYEKIESTYTILEKYCKEGKKEMVGGPWEIYINDPMTEKDPMKLETHVVFPVK